MYSSPSLLSTLQTADTLEGAELLKDVCTSKVLPSFWVHRAAGTPELQRAHHMYNKRCRAIPRCVHTGLRVWASFKGNGASRRAY